MRGRLLRAGRLWLTLMDDLVPTPKEAANAREEWKLAGMVFFGLVAIVLLYETYVILRSFIAPLILGAVLATIAFPMFRPVRARMHNSDATTPAGTM